MSDVSFTKTDKVFFKEKLLPPIYSKRSENAVKNVKEFITNEIVKSGCSTIGFDPIRFSIYKAGFNILIDEVSVYKDLLADIKREYESCITTIDSGNEETLIVKNRVDTVSFIKATKSGYEKRKYDLQEKLEALLKSNALLEKQISQYKQINGQKAHIEDEVISEKLSQPKVHRSSIKNSNKVGVNINPTKESMESSRSNYQIKNNAKPIPGLEVKDWVDEKLLEDSLNKIKKKKLQLLDEKYTKYVKLVNKTTLNNEIASRTKEFEKLERQNNFLIDIEEKLKRIYVKIKIKILEYQSNNSTDRHDFIGHVMDINLAESKVNLLESKAKQEISIDDDPWGFKEADMLLDYIDKFVKLFDETEYKKAAVHAAYSPRGVLRHMEVMKWFEKVSSSWISIPSPIMMFIQALMNSSKGCQQGKLDKDMSILAIKYILKENKVELMQHWTEIKAYTFCSEIGDMLTDYSNKLTKHRVLCLDIAYKMYVEEENHLKVCFVLNKLGQHEQLMFYAYETARFKSSDYLQLLVKCNNQDLVWLLYNPSCSELYGIEKQKEINADDYSRFSEQRAENGLPLRMDEILSTLLNNNCMELARNVLETLYKNFLKKKSLINKKQKEKQDIDNTIYKVGFTQNTACIDQIPYLELEQPVTEFAETDKRELSWSRVANYCENNCLESIESEIRTAIFVKSCVLRTIMNIDLDERAEFDYYN